MMFLITILIWVIGGITLLYNFENKTIRWFSVLVFVIGCSCGKPLVEEVIFPNFAKNLSELPELKHLIRGLGIYMSCFSLFSTPYFILIFYLWYSGNFNENQKIKFRLILSFLLSIPTIAMFVLFPIKINLYPENINFKFLLLWILPYIFVGSYFMIRTINKEKSKRLKDQRIVACLLFIPLCFLGVATSYVMPALGIHNAWKYNRWIVIILFLFYILLATKYGIMGIKLRFEKIQLDSTYKAIFSGTAVMNHAVKNEIIKISMCTDSIKRSKDRNTDEIDANLSIIADSVGHLELMVQKIRENMDDIQLNLKWECLSDILNTSIEMAKPYSMKKNIGFKIDVPKNLFIKCDHVHFKEIFINIIKNAIDAMGEHGSLSINTTISKRNLSILIKDDGQGIPKHLIKKVFDPFYSTKRGVKNFGLGLSYCYNIIKKHGGSIDIESKENIETIVTISFNKNFELR